MLPQKYPKQSYHDLLHLELRRLHIFKAKLETVHTLFIPISSTPTEKSSYKKFPLSRNKNLSTGSVKSIANFQDTTNSI